jgi:hypothetical protein
MQKEAGIRMTTRLLACHLQYPVELRTLSDIVPQIPKNPF